jgi:hypothetical protein
MGRNDHKAEGRNIGGNNDNTPPCLRNITIDEAIVVAEALVSSDWRLPGGWKVSVEDTLFPGG